MEASFSRVSKKLSKELAVLLTVPKFLCPVDRRGASIETALRQELTGEPLRKKNGPARPPRTGQNSSKRHGTMLRENVCRELLMIEEIRGS